MCKWTLHELMERAGCEKWPAHWECIYEDAMEEYEKNGCPLASSEYYTVLTEKYGMLEGVLELYQQAAIQIAQDEALSRLMVLLCVALRDRDKITEDLEEYGGPKAPLGKVALGYNMFNGLAICSMADYCYEKLQKRGLPQEVIKNVMCMPEKGVESYREKHDNEPGYENFSWYQRAIDCTLFNVGRLQIEVFEAMPDGVWVLENKKGEQVALAYEMMLHKSGFQLGAVGFEEEEGSWSATVTETKEYWEGHPYAEDGRVESRVVRLCKSEWKKILCKGDPVIGLHIPEAGKLTPDLIDETMIRIKAFLEEYYPDYPYKAFVCHSWLMDPQLISLVGEDSNIAKFNQRFRKLTRKCFGLAVFIFIFKKDPGTFRLEELPEKTRLERALKAHYMSGKKIYELTGYFMA